MSINVLVNGAFGRMGQATIKALSERGTFTMVGQTGREYDLKKAIEDSGAQVVVDFTNAESVFANAKAIIEAGAHPVIGTTGLILEQIKELQAECAKQKLGGIIAPNFSLGAVLMMKCAREIAKYLPNVEIIEMHHDGKLDSPSGTAMHTAQMIAEANPKVNQPPKGSRETVPHARGASVCDIPVHAIRLPGLLAHQQIIFGGYGETLTIRHDSLNSICFMPGVCLACEKVVALDHLVYGLEHIL